MGLAAGPHTYDHCNTPSQGRGIKIQVLGNPGLRTMAAASWDLPNQAKLMGKLGSLNDRPDMLNNRRDGGLHPRGEKDRKTGQPPGLAVDCCPA